MTSGLPPSSLVPIGAAQILSVTAVQAALATVCLNSKRETQANSLDTAYLVNRYGPFDWRESGPVASLSSDWSGIKVDVFTAQEAFQVYSCGGQNGNSPPLLRTSLALL
jgi:hypothetical protein